MAGTEPTELVFQHLLERPIGKSIGNAFWLVLICWCECDDELRLLETDKPKDLTICVRCVRSVEGHLHAHK